MARQRRSPFEITIDALGSDGRGIGRREDNGKPVHVAGALPGERVIARQTRRSRDHDQAVALQVLQACADRVEPGCPHFGTCGGCVLQHLGGARQIEFKQRTLLELFRRAGVVPEQVLPPLTDQAWGYRRKGRLSVRRVEKKGSTLVGFRELDGRFVADLAECRVVVPAVGARIAQLARLVDGLEGRGAIPQIEFIAGDDAVALVFRHLEPLGADDRAALVAFAREHGFAVFLQPGGVDSLRPLWPTEPPALSFRLEPWNVELGFQPLDFIQVNAGLNRGMVALALELLQPQPGQRVLDLFCGLGNFTLPLARTAGAVVGVEGDAGLVARARENAVRNGLGNVEFHAADLTRDQTGAPWMAAGFDALLLDPPRSGAMEVLRQLPLQRFGRIVYVSCGPESLARDAAYLVNERGWRLRRAGVMDMFPHTAHVESIAMFERDPGRYLRQ